MEAEGGTVAAMADTKRTIPTMTEIVTTKVLNG